MELELCMQRFPCYQEGKKRFDLREFSAETVIPDYAPDISRIVESSAAFFLQRQELQDGQLKVSGTVRMNALYMAEGEKGLKRFEYTLLIEQSFDRLEDFDTVFVEASLSRVEVRVLNPRKLSSHLGIIFSLNTYAAAECALCCDLPKGQKYGIQMLKESKTVSYVKALREKEFVFEEELALSAAKDAALELLRTSQTLHLDECKVLGSKVMLKGSADLSILYLTQGGMQQLSTQLPFSQIVEGCESDAELFSKAVLRIKGAEYRLLQEGSAAGRSIAVKFLMDAFVVLCERRTEECISDLYSTSHRLECETIPCIPTAEGETVIREESLRESIDVGAEVDAVLAAEILLFPASETRSNAQLTLRIPYTAKALYSIDSETVYCAERQGEAVLELPSTGTEEIAKIGVKQLSALPAAGGIELRFTLAAALTERKSTSGSVLTRLMVGEENTASGKTPSLILRRKSAGESLWSLAKEHRTTQEDILSANNAADEAQLRAGQMLLIPRKR